jgi:hypothetical protein
MNFLESGNWTFLLIGVALLVLAFLAKLVADAKTQLKDAENRYSEQLGDASKKLLDAESKISGLEKWQKVEDADKEAGSILQAAKQKAEEIIQEANRSGRVIDEQARARLASSELAYAESKSQSDKEALAAKSEREQLLSAANAQARKLRESSQAELEAAIRQAQNIIEEAKRRAEEVAGNALSAMDNAKLYEATAIAMKNKIEGYGLAYLVPERSILDELAEELAHTEAGVQLKLVRDRARLMVKNRTAATCEYVQAQRQDTAVNFVIDAFNGKVDSILSRAKNDNYGVLAQEIRDAYTLVNFNGKAFREARIAEDYRETRILELKWVVAAQELKKQEREEQRAIKEKIREEEKARREFERAIRDAAKEEDLLRKAMEKATAQLEAASEARRGEFEAKIAELSERLQEAELRGQRALSMAQQTRRGHVYIISNLGSFGENVYKIGLTRRLNPLDRIRELGDSSVPFEFDIHALIFSEDAPSLERHLHKTFVFQQMNKVNYRKEFFRVGLAQIREYVETLGLQATWTSLSKAAEFRETQAIELAISNSPEKREAWLNRQLMLDPVSFEDDFDSETRQEEVA